MHNLADRQDGFVSQTSWIDILFNKTRQLSILKDNLPPPLLPKKELSALPPYAYEKGRYCCEICFSTHSLPGNQFVRCSGCNLLVHMHCYGDVSPDMMNIFD